MCIGADHRVTVPVGRWPIAQLGVHRRTGPRTVVLVIGALVMVTEFNDRDEPVPVQHGHVVVVVGRRVPAQKVIVITTDFARSIVVANVVVVGLGQRHMNEAENQESDSQVACPTPESTPLGRHVLVGSSRVDLQACKLEYSIVSPK